MNIKKPLSLGLVMAAIMLFLNPSLGRAADTIVIKVGMGISEQHYEYRSMTAFKRYVEKASNGTMRVELFPNAMLGSDLEVLESIKLGTVQMNIPTPSVLGNYVKEFRLADLPYLFATEEIANSVAASPWAKTLLKKLEPAGFVGLAIGNFGFRYITNDVRPIHTMADLQGLKIRIMQNNVILEAFRALGTNPTPMGFGEVFSALQTGTIDGQENPYATIYQSRFNEVQKYVSNSKHMYSWGVLVIGKRFYDKLTPDQQKVISDAAEIFRKNMLNASRASEATALQALIEGGMTYTEITPEAQEEMRAAVFPVIEKNGNAISPDMFRALVEEIKAATDG